MARDEALLKNAEIDLARYRQLQAQDSIPEQQLATQESLVQQLRGTVKTDQGLIAGANSRSPIPELPPLFRDAWGCDK